MTCGPAMMLVACLGLAACATVRPYDRERLSRADMTTDADADLHAGADHAKAYREGSSGGTGSSAGGCGCN
jgi:predicted component of type VI protein secretion system